jgi:hypothetical protein
MQWEWLDFDFIVVSLSAEFKWKCGADKKSIGVWKQLAFSLSRKLIDISDAADRIWSALKLVRHKTNKSSEMSNSIRAHSLTSIWDSDHHSNRSAPLQSFWKQLKEQIWREHTFSKLACLRYRCVYNWQRFCARQSVFVCSEWKTQNFRRTIFGYVCVQIVTELTVKMWAFPSFEAWKMIR